LFLLFRAYTTIGIGAVIFVIVVVLGWLFLAKQGVYVIPLPGFLLVKRSANSKPLLARGFLERKPITRRERVESPRPPDIRKV
jgi:hypothetical protein